MPVTITRFDATPNPNALKCSLDRPISDRPRSFRSAQEAADDPLASAVFALGPVTSLLLNGDWLTINKEPDTPWPPLKQALAQLLQGLE